MFLHPGDVRDPESFKVRRGKVGGYREYLSLEDQKYAADALMKLDPRFGYNSGSIGTRIVCSVATPIICQPTSRF